MRAEKEVFLQRIADSEVDSISLCLEGSCAFLLKSLGFISALNIHVFGSQLFKEVFELLMSNDKGLEPSVHTYS